MNGKLRSWEATHLEFSGGRTITLQLKCYMLIAFTACNAPTGTKIYKQECFASEPKRI
jgi:hypothetical protein